MLPRSPALELPFGAETRASRDEEPAPPRSTRPPILTVGELDRRLKRAVEGLELVYVGGEVEDVKGSAAGHTYFTLKDEREQAKIACTLFRTAPPRAQRLVVPGARIVVKGRATIYAPRGSLQLTVEDARPAGRGAHLEALERLKEKLAGEGLFARERKRPLPVGPRVVGVVTSGDGAAIHDIVQVAGRRGRVRILLAKAPVQGEGAADRLARALALLARVPEVEAIVLARGGGSANDLAAFNEEVLVRAVAASPVPVVSAVGHETDTTLVDLAADARAATPSQAAELLVADDRVRRTSVRDLEARLRRAVGHRIRLARAALEQRRAKLVAPERVLASRQQSLDELDRALRGAMRERVRDERRDVGELERRLAARHPVAVVERARAAIAPLEVKLRGAFEAELRRRRAELGASAARLDAMSPLRVLGRGYAIATDAEGRAVRDARDVRDGEALRVRLHRGALEVRVEGREEIDG